MWKSKLQKMWNFSWNWASNFHVCTQKHCKSGFSKKKVHRDSVSLVTSIISRIFCSLSFSAILLQLNLCKSYFGSFGLLRSIWITGITDLILKLLFKDSKSLAIVMPSFIMPFKSKGYWLVLLEELCQFYWILFLYQFWFHYLICYREFNNKILGYYYLYSTSFWNFGFLCFFVCLFGNLRTFRALLWILFTWPSWSDLLRCGWYLFNMPTWISESYFSYLSACIFWRVHYLTVLQREYRSAVQKRDFRPYKQMERWGYLITPSNVIKSYKQLKPQNIHCIGYGLLLKALGRILGLKK